MKATALISLCLLSSFLMRAEGQTLSNAKQLYTDIFANHRKEVRPNSDYTVPLQINITFFINTITRFEEVEETIVLMSGFGLSWIDDGISWNPTSYGNLESLHLSQDDIWTPQIILVNTVDVLQPIEGDSSFPVIVSYNGSVFFNTGGILSAKCNPNIAKFPFDIQTCSLMFAAWGHADNSINFTTDSTSPVDVSFYVKNSDWNLESYSGKTFRWNGYSIFEVQLTVQREPLYYTIIVLIPCAIFGFINPLVFILPVDSGERIGFSTTILLSYAIFLTLVTAAIPATSNPMSVMLLTLIVTIIGSGFIVVLAIFTTTIYHRDENKKMNSVWKFIGSKMPWHKNNKPSSVEPETAPEKTECWTSKEITWKDVCDSLDWLFMIISYIFMTLLIIILIALLL